MRGNDCKIAVSGIVSNTVKADQATSWSVTQQHVNMAAAVSDGIARQFPSKVE